MSRILLDIIGEDIVALIFGIGSLRVHQLKNGEWHAYVVAEGDPQEYEYAKLEREMHIKEHMSGRHISVLKDVNDDIITGATRKELIRIIKKNPPVWSILFDLFWTGT